MTINSNHFCLSDKEGIQSNIVSFLFFFSQTLKSWTCCDGSRVCAETSTNGGWMEQRDAADNSNKRQEVMNQAFTWEELMSKLLSGIITWTITHVLFHPLHFVVAQFSPLPTSCLSACIFPDVPFF